MEKKPLSLEEIARLTQAELIGDKQHLITGVADLETASSHEASFLAIPPYGQRNRYTQQMQDTKAGVIFVASQEELPSGPAYLIVKDPSAAFQRLVDYFYQATTFTYFEGIHPTAVVHPTAVIGQHVTIGPHAVVDGHVNIGDRTVIGAGCYIGPHTQIGSDCLLHPHVMVRERCRIGNKVILQPGAIIGSCGFGYATDEKGQHTKLNQVGTVTIEDDVEIGANTTIDRARFKTTLISKGTKIDNLVQIAHGVKLGIGNIIVAQAGIAGSTSTGRHVVIAGQSAVAGHLHLCDGVIIAGKSGVSKSINKPGKYGGIPVQPLAEYNRNSVLLRNIETYITQLKALVKKES